MPGAEVPFLVGFGPSELEEETEERYAASVP